MKNISCFFLSLSIILVLVASCNPDPVPPSIVINHGETIVIDKEKTDSLLIPVSVSSVESSIYRFKISVLYRNGHEYLLKEIRFENPVFDFADTCLYSDLPYNIIRFSSLLVSATNIEGIQRTVLSNFSFFNYGTPLEAELPFEWKRIGINDGKGMSEFGLKWDNHITEPRADIQRNLDVAAKLVKLTPRIWEDAATVETLVDAIEAASPIDSYASVSTTGSASYNDVIGVKLKNGNYYMLHITKGIVEEQAASGPVVTINGTYKYVLKEE